MPSIQSFSGMQLLEDILLGSNAALHLKALLEEGLAWY